MQPTTNPLPHNPNSAPQPVVPPGHEHKHDKGQHTEHVQPGHKVELQPSTVETSHDQPSAASAPASAPASPTVQAQSAVPATPSAQPTAQPISTSVSAEDKDTIEKAWIDQADTIIATQQDDPFVEEESQENLSQEYLKARFNLNTKQIDKAP